MVERSEVRTLCVIDAVTLAINESAFVMVHVIRKQMMHHNNYSDAEL